MKNKIKALFVCTVLLLSLSGCYIPGITQPDDDDDYLFTKTAKVNEREQSDETIEYSWLVNPQIRASNIITFDGSQIDPSLKKNDSYRKYAIIYNDGKYGFINYEGKKVVPTSYDHFYLCPCGEMVLYNIISDEGEYEYCSIDNKGKIKSTITNHENNSSLYYWDAGKKKTYEKNADNNYISEYVSKNSVVALKTEVTSLGGGKFAASQQGNPAYGLIKNNRIILDFKYDDFYVPAFNTNDKSIIAFMDDGKWGYINGKGKEIITFNCNAILSSDCGEVIDYSGKSHPYLYSDGFLAASTDAGCCYYNTKGQCVIPTGEFEQVRPVHNGKAWVRQNGYWGVVKIGDIVEESSNYTTKKTTTSTTSKSSKTTKKSDKTSKTTKTTKKTTNKKTTAKKTTAKKTTKKVTTHKVSTKATTTLPVTTAPPETTSSIVTEKTTAPQDTEIVTSIENE